MADEVQFTVEAAEYDDRYFKAFERAKKLINLKFYIPLTLFG
jgi:hypothetical protein